MGSQRRITRTSFAYAGLSPDCRALDTDKSVIASQWLIRKFTCESSASVDGFKADLTYLATSFCQEHKGPIKMSLFCGLHRKVRPCAVQPVPQGIFRVLFR